ncbi:bifunctional riboflavin kinase/FAD synthetase [soil metagenome]
MNPTTGANGTVVTVGTFDGVHRGHWQVLEALAEAARNRSARSLLVTFDPHPLRIVRPAVAPQLLTTPSEKIEFLAQSAVELVALLRFTPELAAFPPRAFVEEILIARFGMSHLVIGYDHGFGQGRSGDVDTLRSIGLSLGFGVDVVEPVYARAGDAISSSGIRTALVAGDVVSAAGALGRPYSLTGTVVRGEGQGHRLGFPTANLDVAHADKLIPHEGIYAVRAALRDHFADGVLHLGPRPTFAGLPPSIELHLFDFDGDLYGNRVRVEFIDRVRDIARFDSTDALIRAMEADCAEARRLLADAASG